MPQGDRAFAEWLKDGTVLCATMNTLGASIQINESKMAFKQTVRTLS